MIDLFKICVPENKLHHNFKEINNGTNEVAIKYLNNWAKDFVDRDNKMVIEFQTTFNSTFWELYLFNVLKMWSIPVDFSINRPDFICNAYGNFSIEAVIASNAIYDKPEWEHDISLINKDEFLPNLIRLASIRLANAITSKYKKYLSEYSSLLHVKNKSFIIALAPFEQPFFWEQDQSAILQVLYGIKGFRYENDEVNNERKILGIDYIDYVEKDNGAQIDLGLFSQDYMPEISGIIFNSCATFGKIRALTKSVDKRDMIFRFSRFNKNGLHPSEGAVHKNEYSETMEDGMNLYLNPNARYPLNEEFIDLFPSVHSYDDLYKSTLSETKDGALFKRMVTVINTYE